MTDDPTFSSPEELLSYQRETDRLARENRDLANSNYANCVPWRFLRWRRTDKQIRANQREVERRIAVGERGFTAVFTQARHNVGRRMS